MFDKTKAEMIRPWFRQAAVPWKTTATQTRASGENRVSTKPGVLQGVVAAAGQQPGEETVGGEDVPGCGQVMLAGLLVRAEPAPVTPTDQRSPAAQAQD